MFRILLAPDYNITFSLTSTGEESWSSDDVVNDRRHLSAIGRLRTVHYHLDMTWFGHEHDKLLEQPETHWRSIRHP